MKPARALLGLIAAACAQALALGAAPAAKPATPPVPTVIESDGPGVMVSTPTETTFTARDNVVVTATNLRMNCDVLTVVSGRTGDPAATLGKQEGFKSLVATGNVRILQNDREATCQRAEIFPGEDKVVLSGNFKLRALDNSFVQTGDKGTLYRGERKAVIEGAGASRPTLTLPPLKDLGYDKQPEKKKGAPDAKAPKSPAVPADALPPITVPLPNPPK